MINIKINLSDGKTEYDFMSYMETYILYGEKRTLIVIFPDGEYGMVSDRETERITTAYNASGSQAAIINPPALICVLISKDILSAGGYLFFTVCFLKRFLFLL